MSNPLRRKRESMGLPLQALADELNTTIVTISRYENGKRFPHLSELLDIINAYKLNTDEVIEYIKYCKERSGKSER